MGRCRQHMFFQVYLQSNVKRVSSSTSLCLHIILGGGVEDSGVANI